jgi:hypothetical protein
VEQMGLQASRDAAEEGQLVRGTTEAESIPEEEPALRAIDGGGVWMQAEAVVEAVGLHARDKKAAAAEAEPVAMHEAAAAAAGCVAMEEAAAAARGMEQATEGADGAAWEAGVEGTEMEGGTGMEGGAGEVLAVQAEAGAATEGQQAWGAGTQAGMPIQVGAVADAVAFFADDAGGPQSGAGRAVAGISREEAGREDWHLTQEASAATPYLGACGLGAPLHFPSRDVGTQCDADGRAGRAEPHVWGVLPSSSTADAGTQCGPDSNVARGARPLSCVSDSASASGVRVSGVGMVGTSRTAGTGGLGAAVTGTGAGPSAVEGAGARRAALTRSNPPLCTPPRPRPCPQPRIPHPSSRGRWPREYEQSIVFHDPKGHAGLRRTTALLCR